MPIWDDGIQPPDSGFTTRFELSSRLDQDADLQSDLACLFRDDDRTLLAILAASMLKRLDVDGRVWDLDLDDPGNDGSYAASAWSADEVWRWRLFPVEFQPSRQAIARFLKHRRIRPDDLPEEEREAGLHCGGATAPRARGAALGRAGCPGSAAKRSDLRHTADGRYAAIRAARQRGPGC